MRRNGRYGSKDFFEKSRKVIKYELIVCLRKKNGYPKVNQDFICLRKKTGPPEQTKTPSVCYGEQRRYKSPITLWVPKINDCFIVGKRRNMSPNDVGHQSLRPCYRTREQSDIGQCDLIVERDTNHLCSTKRKTYYGIVITSRYGLAIS